MAPTAGKTAVTRQWLETIVALGEAHAVDLDDRLMIVDFLLVTWVELPGWDFRGVTTSGPSSS